MLFLPALCLLPLLPSHLTHIEKQAFAFYQQYYFDSSEEKFWNLIYYD